MDLEAHHRARRCTVGREATAQTRVSQPAISPPGNTVTRADVDVPVLTYRESLKRAVRKGWPFTGAE